MTNDDEPGIDLGALPREAAPPAGLEDRVVRELRRTGQLRPRRLSRYALAAGLALFGLGLAAGRLLVPRAAAPPASYALLLYRGAEAETTPREGERRVGEIIGWMRQVRAQGRHLTGEKLGSEALKLGAEEVASSGSSELQGFFLLEARSLADAEEIARACPHLSYGGVIVVRPLEKT